MKDHLAIVTGAGSGIGYATALALSSRGARIAAIDLNADSASATADAIRKAVAGAGYHPPSIAPTLAAKGAELLR